MNNLLEKVQEMLEEEFGDENEYAWDYESPLVTVRDILENGTKTNLWEVSAIEDRNFDAFNAVETGSWAAAWRQVPEEDVDEDYWDWEEILVEVKVTNMKKEEALKLLDDPDIFDETDIWKKIEIEITDVYIL